MPGVPTAFFKVPSPCTLALSDGWLVLVFGSLLRDLLLRRLELFLLYFLLHLLFVESPLLVKFRLD